MLLKQKIMLISREVIERARQRDEQTEVLTEVRTRFQGPQYVLSLTVALLTSYTVNARYAEPAFGRLTTRAINDNNNNNNSNNDNDNNNNYNNNINNDNYYINMKKYVVE